MKKVQRRLNPLLMKCRKVHTYREFSGKLVRDRKECYEKIIVVFGVSYVSVD